MTSKSSYGFIGLIIGAIVEIIIHLIAISLHEGPFKISFSKWSFILLVVLALLGLLAGRWLGSEVPMPDKNQNIERLGRPSARPPLNTQGVKVTRLRALLSSLKIRGRGVSLDDVKARGSRIDIDTRDEDHR